MNMDYQTILNSMPVQQVQAQSNDVMGRELQKTPDDVLTLIRRHGDEYWYSGKESKLAGYYKVGNTDDFMYGVIPCDQWNLLTPMETRPKPTSVLQQQQQQE